MPTAPGETAPPLGGGLQPKSPPTGQADALLALAIAAVGIAASLACSAQIASRVVQPVFDNRWFEGDAWRSVAVMLSRGASQERAGLHPLFGLLTVPCTEAISRVSGCSPLMAARILIAAVAGACGAVTFLILRRIGCRWLDAALFALLLYASSTGVFWFGVPETYPLSALGILLVSFAIVAGGRGPRSWGWLAVASVFAAGINMSTALLAGVAALAAHPWRRALSAGAVAAGLLIGLTWVQSRLVSGAPAIPLTGSSAELSYATPPTPARIVESTRVLVCHSLLMPDVNQRPNPVDPRVKYYSVQSAGIRVSLVSIVGVALWLALLGVGFLSVLRGAVDRRIGTALLAALAAQLALFCFYGAESFLYAAHVLPLLILIAGCGAATGRRILVTLAAALLLAIALAVNVPAFLRCAAALSDA